MTVAAPIPWFGGKSLLARRIAALLPPHRSYVEVFGGSGAVLFAKGRSHFEVWNDLDDGLVHFFRTLREQPDELAEAVRLTPFSRAEFQACFATWRDAEAVERARRWYVAIAQSFNATPPSGGKGGGWRGEYAGASHVPAPRDFASSAAALQTCAERFRGVQVESLDWREVLRRYDGPEACFYLDPPYVHGTRSQPRGYAHEMTDDDHAELVAAVAAAPLAGRAHIRLRAPALCATDRGRLRAPQLPGHRPRRRPAGRHRPAAREERQPHRSDMAPRRRGALLSLTIVPVTFRQASAFVAQHHRHHAPPRGCRFVLGVACDSGELVGVAMVGRPVARAYDDGLTVEVNRTCTDGTPHANSALYGAAWRAAKALGYRRLVTYTQEGESGASLRAAGWRVVAERPARGSWADSSVRLRNLRDPVGAGGVQRTLWEAE